MIGYDGELYSSDVNLIYNPVSIQNDKKFHTIAKKLHPKVYNEYCNMIYNDFVKLGEIQLIQTDHCEKQCVLNAFVYNKYGKINMLAFVKTLVELCNIASEYGLVVGISRKTIYSKNWDSNMIEKIIEEVFRDTDVEVRLYK